MKSFKSVYKYITIIAIAFTVALGFSAAADASGSFTRVPFGARSYNIFVPSSYTPGVAVPLVVMNHGCTQNSVDFATGTQMNQIAEQENFIVIYPEQPMSQHFNRCWNWFETAHQRRGSGEPQVIVDMVNQVKSNFTINSDAVFAAGLSAGGALTTNLAVLYPDVFTAVSVNAGLAFQSGTSLLNATSAMNGSPATNPATAAGNAFNQVPANARRVVPTIVFHGTADATVRPAAGEQVVTQMISYNSRTDASISAANRTTENGSANGLNFALHSFRNGAGDIIIQHYVITGLGHHWAGGNPAGSHTSASGPNASLVSWRFFQQAAGLDGNSTTPPVVEPPVVEPPVVEPPVVEPPVVEPPVVEPPVVEPPVDPTPDPTPQFTYVRANVNQHNMAGRIPATLFFHYFSLHGPTGLFNMYQVVGTNTWTSTRPGS